MRRQPRRVGPRAWTLLLACAISAHDLAAQAPTIVEGTIRGTVADAATARPVAGATVSVEGTTLAVLADTIGRFVLRRVPVGPQTIRVQRLGYAPARRQLDVSRNDEMVVDIALARSALNLRGVVVTADPVGRARGELGSASVIESEAIRNQTAASLAGILELIPGVPLTAPGLDAVQQIGLRSVPIAPPAGVGNSATATERSAEQLAAFGTQIVIDGVPISNNANLQTLGPRAELTIPTAAGGGIDLRQIPAATLERVEVIRGIPSARWGDLTNGVIVIDTRAGEIAPVGSLRFDAHTIEANVLAGTAASAAQLISGGINFARTQTAPGLNENRTYRLTAQLAHRLEVGASADPGSEPRAVYDTRVDISRLFEDDPASPQFPGTSGFSHDAGFRLSERARWRVGGSGLSLTMGYERLDQRSFSQQALGRPAMPFTDRTTPGRAIGKFVGGTYDARVNVDGTPQDFYSRFELSRRIHWAGADHELRAGTELRREWNQGAGYQFNIEFPPQVSFNGVQGFDRPRSYDAIPPLVTSAAYVDDRISHQLGAMTLQVQGGLRLDVLHRGDLWLSPPRNAVLEPRLNVELDVTRWLRFRAGAGRMAKAPALADLYPPPQFNDVVNVNWYVNNPAGRLAVLTTSVFDPSNARLGYSVGDRAEVGTEIEIAPLGVSMSLVAWTDRLAGGVGVHPVPTYIVRDHYQLSDSSTTSGTMPTIVDPPYAHDTVPILIDRRANNLRVHGDGAEAILTIADVPRIRTSLSTQFSYARSVVQSDDIELLNTNFSAFQVADRIPRVPYWTGSRRVGERMLLTTRIIHHQPAVGLIITATIQHTLREVTLEEGATDTLSFTGYMTRAGVLVPVPRAQRGDPQFSDLHLSRTGQLAGLQATPVQWIASLQVAKTLPLGGRISFYMFNVFDKIGSYGGAGVAPLLYPSSRFGLELALPILSTLGVR